MDVEFADNDPDFDEICEELDPQKTGRIQFDKLIAKLTATPGEGDEELDSMIADLENEQGFKE